MYMANVSAILEVQMSLEPESYETSRRAAAVNSLLGQIGLSTGAENEWWNHQAYEELGGLTTTQSWLNGNHSGVARLVEEWYAVTNAAVERCIRDAAFVAMLYDLSTEQKAKYSLRAWGERDNPQYRVWRLVEQWILGLNTIPWQVPSQPLTENTRKSWEIRVAEVPGSSGVRVFYEHERTSSSVSILYVGH